MEACDEDFHCLSLLCMQLYLPLIAAFETPSCQHATSKQNSVLTKDASHLLLPQTQPFAQVELTPSEAHR